MPKVICSPCGKEFKTEEEYLNHKCSKADGAKPTEPEYLIKTTTPNLVKIQESAIKRGEENKLKK